MRNPDFHLDVGKRLTELRKREQFTQAELAGMLGVSQQTVFAYELGDRRVSLDKVPVLVRAFRITADALLGIEPLPAVKPVRVYPAEQRLVHQLRRLPHTDRLAIARIVEALQRR